MNRIGRYLILGLGVMSLSSAAFAAAEIGPAPDTPNGGDTVVNYGIGADISVGGDVRHMGLGDARIGDNYLGDNRHRDVILKLGPAVNDNTVLGNTDRRRHVANDQGSPPDTSDHFDYRLNISLAGLDPRGHGLQLYFAGANDLALAAA